MRHVANKWGFLEIAPDPVVEIMSLDDRWKASH
jgi:hypothetical protein